MKNTERSYENIRDKEFWMKQIMELKKGILNYVSEVDDRILKKVQPIMTKFGKSNSLVENINNQIRRYLDGYKSIPKYFPSLFTYYWNFKVFKRGKRKGFAPIELLTKSKLTF